MGKVIKDGPTYEVNEFGQVRNIRKNKILSGTVDSNGYIKIHIGCDGVGKQLYVHRVVAEAFIPKVEGKPFINHIDCNPSNNYYKNLEWCTQKENVNGALTLGRMTNKQFNRGVILETENEIIEFESIKLCAEYLGVSRAIVRGGLYEGRGKYKLRFKEKDDD